MKEVKLHLYSFDELSEDVQKQIIDRERWNVMQQCMDAYSGDYRESLKAFEELTGTTACDWSVDYCGYQFNFKYSDKLIYENPIDFSKDIYMDDLCGKLLFRYIDNNIIPCITERKAYFTSGKYIDGKYTYKKHKSNIIKTIGEGCPLTGMCYDHYILEPLIRYYKNWCNYTDGFSFTDLMEECYGSFFKSWHEEYEYWADNENAIREQLHSNQYEKRMYFNDGQVYDGPLDNIA